jgi:hypothetical protein
MHSEPYPTDEELETTTTAIIDWVIAWIEERDPEFFLPDDEKG